MRPYRHNRMTTALWREIPREQVCVAELVPTQEQVSLAAVINPPEHTWSGDEALHIVRHKGVLYIEDGHHRYARAVLKGHRYLTARVLDA